MKTLAWARRAGIALVVVNAHPAIASAGCPVPDPQTVQADVQAMFDAAAVGNQALAQAHFTPDAYLFDGGGIYNAAGILDVIRDRRQEGTTYVWKVTDPDVRFLCDTASIAYVNRGAAIKNGQTTPVMWLESMILKAASGHWLIEFAHSTKVTNPAPLHAKALAPSEDATYGQAKP